jgi:hypothetical protein
MSRLFEQITLAREFCTPVKGNEGYQGIPPIFPFLEDDHRRRSTPLHERTKEPIVVIPYANSAWLSLVTTLIATSLIGIAHARPCIVIR